MRTLNLEEYKIHLQDNGYKCTPQRLEILSFFVHYPSRFISAKLVIKHFQEAAGNPSLDTVYRNLFLFRDLGLMESIFREGENLFYLKSNPTAHYHLFICTECLSVTELDICPMNIMEVSLPNYQIHHHKFEVYGVCPICKS
ncbi:Fur family transcriptional regulator [Priestia endophytica]|uniref:Fur family transcriptional regulator n=1 Tax=Priestia endophytica TaxID=135735 RepID=UPI003D2666F7